MRKFPGGSVVRTLCSHNSIPRLGKKILQAAGPKEKKKKEKEKNVFWVLKEDLYIYAFNNMCLGNSIHFETKVFEGEHKSEEFHQFVSYGASYTC